MNETLQDIMEELAEDLKTYLRRYRWSITKGMLEDDDGEYVKIEDVVGFIVANGLIES